MSLPFLLTIITMIFVYRALQFCYFFLRVGKNFSILEGNLQHGVLGMEGVLQPVEVAGTLPFAHGEVVEVIVTTGLRCRSRHLVLGENPLQTLDGEATHVLHRITAGHDDIHAGEASHGSDIDDIVLHGGVAEPRGHEVLDAMHGSRSDSRLPVGFGDTEVEGGEATVYTGDVDAGLQVRMIDRKTLNYFHNLFYFLQEGSGNVSRGDAGL